MFLGAVAPGFRWAGGGLRTALVLGDRRAAPGTDTHRWWSGCVWLRLGVLVFVLIVGYVVDGDVRWELIPDVLDGAA